ncbi:MAG: protease complex subunit PrcB family protein [Burkholderiaceae bacterium]
MTHGAPDVIARTLTIAALAAGLGGCAGMGAAPTTVATLDSTGYAMCPWAGGEAGVVDVHDQRGFEALLAQAGLEAPRVAGWKPDFPRDRIVLVAVGPRPSAGYRVEWIDATQLGQRLRGRVEIRPPSSGEMSATVIIRPCVVAWVRAPGVREVEIFDARSGDPLLEP